MKVPEDVVKALEDAKSALIIIHPNPDGDAIGSAIAMGLGLKQLGKDVDYYVDSNIQSKLKFFDEMENFNKDLKDHYDVELILDCSSYDYTVHPENAPHFDKRVVIDHHKTNENYGDHNFAKITGAAGELVYFVLEALGVDFTPEMKEAIFTALTSDTGSFQFANTTGQTHEVISKIYDEENQNDFAHISKRLHKLKTLEQQRLFGSAIDSMKLYADGKVAILKLPYEVIEENGGTTNVTDDITNIGMDTDGVIVSAFIREREPGVFRLSFRSKAGYDIDVSELGTKYEGGGHERASGGNYIGTMDEIESELISVLSDLVEGIEVNHELS